MEKNYLLWLSLIKGVGSKRAEILLKYFKSAENIYKANYREFEQIKGIGANFIEKFREAKKININEKLETLEKLNINFYIKEDEDYPQLLKEIYDPPLILYVNGSLSKLPMVGIVGSRLCSSYGLTISHEISKILSENNICVVSGLARGIDTKSHEGALAGKSPTIAVVASGVDICYPSENKGLYEKIKLNGAIISEHFPGMKPLKEFFPMRNRIISGMSSAVVIVEASSKSGSLITAKKAIEQNRDVYAVPGNITNELSFGTNSLIRDGARILTTPMDIIEDMNMTFTPIKVEKIKPKFEDEEQKIYDLIILETLTIEEIMTRLDGSYQNTQYTLTMLELKGAATRLPGGRYSGI